MRVLAHVHTYNDAEVIDQIIAALQAQTRPLDGIIIVDNASSDETLDRKFPENVVVVRNRENLGTSGAVHIGLAHGLKHEYDWAWVFDADSVPAPTTLEKLLAFYEGLSKEEQQKICFLASDMVTATGKPRDVPMIFTKSSIDYIRFAPELPAIRCDCFIWTATLFRMAAVHNIGLPSPDYVLDVAELEYGFRARELGFVSYMVNGAATEQDVGRPPGVVARSWGLGPFTLQLFEIPPARCYYHIRNMLYFWLYQCRPRRPKRIIRSLIHGVMFPRTFIVRPFTHYKHLIACMRGFWDGLTMHMERRY